MKNYLKTFEQFVNENLNESESVSKGFYTMAKHIRKNGYNANTYFGILNRYGDNLEDATTYKTAKEILNNIKIGSIQHYDFLTRSRTQLDVKKLVNMFDSNEKKIYDLSIQALELTIEFYDMFKEALLYFKTEEVDKALTYVKPLDKLLKQLHVIVVDKHNHLADKIHLLNHSDDPKIQLLQEIEPNIDLIY